MARTRIYDLTEHTTPADDDYLIIDRSGWTAAKKINASGAIPLRYVGSGWSLRGGGNNRGDQAVDLQTYREADTQVASGTAAVIGGGATNTASGAAAVIGGGQGNVASQALTTVSGGGSNTASAEYSTIGGGTGNIANSSHAVVAGGYQNTAGNYSAVGGGKRNEATGMYSCVPGGAEALASKVGQLAHAAGRFAADGDAQRSAYVLRQTTTDATPTVLMLDGLAFRLTIADDTVWNFRAEIAAMTADAAKYAAYTVTGLVKRANGTVAVAGVATAVINESDAGWDATAEADDTNKALAIKVTGATSQTIRWVAAVYTTEVTFGS